MDPKLFPYYYYFHKIAHLLLKISGTWFSTKKKKPLGTFTAFTRKDKKYNFAKLLQLFIIIFSHMKKNDFNQHLPKEAYKTSKFTHL